MKVLKIEGDIALCELNGVRREVALQLVDAQSVAIGDYLVVHLGFAIERIKADLAINAEQTWAQWQDFIDKKENSNA